MTYEVSQGLKEFCAEIKKKKKTMLSELPLWSILIIHMAYFKPGMDGMEWTGRDNVCFLIALGRKFSLFDGANYLMLKYHSRL